MELFSLSGNVFTIGGFGLSQKAECFRGIWIKGLSPEVDNPRPARDVGDNLCWHETFNNQDSNNNNNPSIVLLNFEQGRMWTLKEDKRHHNTNRYRGNNDQWSFS